MFRRSLLCALITAVGCTSGMGDDPGESEAQGVAGAACTVKYAPHESWPGGYKAEVTLINGGADKSSWTLTWKFPGGQRLQNLWNGEATQTGSAVSVRSMPWNGRIARNGAATIGFVANGEAKAPTDFAVDGVACAGSGAPPSPTTPPTTTPTTPPTSTPTTPPAEPPKPTGSPVAQHGKLHVCGMHLCDQSNAMVQLRGISTHGLQWYGWNKRCLGPSSLDSLSKEWKADLVRIALYVQEGGYETDPAGYRAQVDTLVDEIGKRGMYALIDWHILSPGDPTYNLARAKEFFRYVADKHGSKSHVLFEIANEPNGVGWGTIRDYAQQVLGVIRDEKKLDTVTIVGTPDWSSLGKSGGHSPDDIVSQPPRNASGAAYGNVMYTFHFYAASHKDDYRSMVRAYADKFPIFVTEWGTPTYSGDGAVDEASTRAWLDLMIEKKLSWAYWNLSDNGQSGALLKPGACDTGKTTWTGTALQRSGQLIFTELTTK